jgi:hypothetical protein
MAERRSNAAIAEMSELSPEESAVLDADKEGTDAPELPPEPEEAPERAAPVAKAAPEPEADPDVDPRTGRQRKVDYGAFHEERERRKSETKARIDAEQKFATLNGRLEVLQELARAAQQQQQAPQIEVPDISENPVGHFQAQIALRDQKIAEFDQWRQQQAQEQQQREYQANQVMGQLQVQQQQNEMVGQVRNVAIQAEQEFSKSVPDYQDAASHVQKTRLAQLTALGVPNPEQQLQVEALQMAAGALQQGRNPAAVIYDMAKATGWTGKTRPAAVASPGAQKLATVARGQSANASLSQVSGSAPAEMSVNKLLEMSDEEFAEATKGGKWAKLFS